MSPEDHARDLIAESSDWAVEQGAREGIPVGLTWASLIPGDRDDFDQKAWERANGKEMEAALEGAAEEAEYNTLRGTLVVRILDQDGDVTPEGIVAAELMCALADYPILDEETYREIQDLGLENDWEGILYEIENGRLWVWEHDRRDVQVIDEDELPKDWQEKVQTAYYERAQNFSEEPTDDNDYHSIDRSELAKVLYELGLLEGEGEDE